MKAPALFLSLALLPLAAPAQDRVPYVIDETYDGSHRATFDRLRWQVPNLLRQTLIDLSVRLGLNFQDDWSVPLIIRFADGAPRGAESALAYVRMMPEAGGAYRQVLGINLAAYERESFDFEKVLAHELVHAMLNDALGTDAREIPVWLHEGLAVYGADQGDQMVASYVHRFKKAGVNVNFLNGLDGPHGALDYMEDYLAIQYLRERHGINSLHNFMREVVRRKGDVPGAIEAACFEDFETFQRNAREFAAERIFSEGRTHRGRDGPGRAY